MNRLKSKKKSRDELYEHKAKNYYIYIIRCENNILYTGIATDYKRRFDEHAKVNGSKKGAKFTKSHKPEEIVAVWKTRTRSDALKLEVRIKQLVKADKEKLIDDNSLFKNYFTNLIDCRKFRRVN
jgi:putative endonuclease